MASWLHVQNNRHFETPETLIKACSNMTGENGGLKASSLGAFFDSPAFGMAWKAVDGDDITLIEINHLLRSGYIYLISNPKSGPKTPPTQFSHACVIYGCSDPNAAEDFPRLKRVDPILGVDEWMLTGVRWNKLILAVAKETLNTVNANPNMAPWIAKQDGKEVILYTPAIPPRP